jgi:hypothetical protein
MRRLMAMLLPVLLVGYLAVGYGYHRLSKACWETRHADDPEQEVYGGALGVAIDLGLWPVFLAADKIQCSPDRG